MRLHLPDAALVSIGLAFAAVATSASSATRWTRADIPMVCSASFKPKARLDAVAACEAVRRAMALTEKRNVRLVSSTRITAADHLIVSIIQPRTNAVQMAAKGRLNGRIITFGPVAVDVMDRPLRQTDVDRLAKTMADGISRR